MYAFDLYHTKTLKTPSIVLSNCDFEYFLHDYEALIYVETNNFYPVIDPSTPTSGFMKYLGDDNGVDMLITGSNFSKSRFCKGAIVYRSAPYLDYATLFNYTA